MRDINDLTGNVIGAAMDVHGKLGPGLLESTYEACLAAELTRRGLRFERQVEVPIVYDGLLLECGYRLDVLVERQLVVELKSVTALDEVHTAQVLTYLRFGGWPVGLLLNFNVERLRHGGIRRLVLGYVGASPRPHPSPRFHHQPYPAAEPE